VEFQDNLFQLMMVPLEPVAINIPLQLCVPRLRSLAAAHQAIGEKRVA